MFSSFFKILAPLVVMVAAIGYIGHNYINYVEKKREPVVIQKNTHKVLFFYRDDCSDCQSIFHQVYWKNMMNHDIEFINMNEVSNRQYIKQYDLVSVPTFIHEDNRYSGTNMDEVKKVIGE